ncbi:hypothetical protein ACFX13_027218 [Malus domestica]
MHTMEDGYDSVDLVVTQTLVLHVTELLITCPISAEVLEPTPRGVRKAVLATSPAEISWLMLNSIQYFIDSGLCKMKSYDLMAGKELDRRLGFGDVFKFGFVDPPAPEALAQALQQLIRRGVLDNDLGELTQVGNQMADSFIIHVMENRKTC